MLFDENHCESTPKLYRSQILGESVYTGFPRPPTASYPLSDNKPHLSSLYLFPYQSHHEARKAYGWWYHRLGYRLWRVSSFTSLIHFL